MTRGRVRGTLERIPDALPGLAVLAALAAIAVPSVTVAAAVDELLAALVLVTALDIDPAQLRAVAARWRMVLVLSVAPLVGFALLAKVIAVVAGGATGVGVLGVGLAPTEVASVGLIALMGGPVELALGVLAGSLWSRHCWVRRRSGCWPPMPPMSTCRRCLAGSRSS